MSNIYQDKNFNFIGYKKLLYAGNLQYSFLFSNLDCQKEYYFVIIYSGYTKNIDYHELSVLLFNIIDANIDVINLSPELSDIFLFHQRNKTKKEIIFYSHNETKYGLINFISNTTIQIFKNDEIIYEKGEKDFKKEILFEKNENYTIHFMGYKKYIFSLQLFNETPILKYDLKKGPIVLYYSPIYYFEIDISQFEINDIILLDFYGDSTYSIKYQYKSKFIGNNFNYLGIFEGHNYIPIKNTIKDSSLIISIETYDNYYDWRDFNILNLIPDKIEEINSEFKQEIKGPKYYFIDYNEFNNMNSIGFLANESFYIFEEKNGFRTSLSKDYYHVFITSINNYAVNTFKSAIIYFNSSNNILFEIKKYNYPFLGIDSPYYCVDYEYFQLCQGNDTLDEMYFYLLNHDIFQPVFGSFDSYFIKISDIRNSSDLDFDNKELSSYYKKHNQKGFLKIKCKAPLMLKHIILSSRNLFDFNELNSGEKYYIQLDYYNRKNYTFNKSLINKDLKIKITIFGLEPNKFIKFFFNNNTYNLTNKSFELNFTYENYSSHLFSFEEIDENYDYTLIAEIKVGILPENISKTIKQIDFKDSLETLNIKGKESVIIKIPQNFTNDLFDFSINLEDSYKFYIDISYDKIEFQTIFKKLAYYSLPFIPLFKANPYNYVESNLLNSESNNKSFYILIYNKWDLQTTIYFQKPRLFSDSKFNTINHLQQLIGDNNKYYYQIKFPNPDGNYRYLLIQYQT